MSKDHWDAILASAPLNVTAATVTSKGYEYQPAKRINSREWDAPPRLRRLSRDMLDLVGVKFGRFTVIGLLDEDTPPGKKATWVCRCACGRYSGRHSKSIRNPANSEDRCELCRHAKFLAESASGDRARQRAESEKARKW